MPTRGTVGTSSSDPAREKIGIDNYFSIVQSHEKAHAKIYTDAYTGAPAQLKGLTPAEAQKKFNEIVCQSFKDQDSLDKATGCMVICCSTGNEKDASAGGASECGLTPNAAASCP
jgi:hypothetical protein